MSEECPEGVRQEEWDSARRLADTVNVHVHAVLAGGDRTKPAYVAIRLQDGSSPDNGTLYDSREDASFHMRHETAVFFLKVDRELITPQLALMQLQIYRKANAAGYQVGRTEVLVPHLMENLNNVLPRTMRGINGNGNR